VKRFLLGALLSTALLFGGRAAGGEIRFEVAPQGTAKSQSNQEIIELLKQVIQKLEAQDGVRRPGAADPAAKAQLDQARQALEAMLKAQQKRLAESGELKKAQQELDEAKRRVQEAEAKVRKLQGGAGAGWTIQPGAPIKVIPVKPDAKWGELKPGQREIRVPGATIELELRPRKVEAKPVERARTADPKSDTLEKRVDALMREIEEIRKELKKSR
jgi:hypothetical protein